MHSKTPEILKFLFYKISDKFCDVINCAFLRQFNVKFNFSDLQFSRILSRNQEQEDYAMRSRMNRLSIIPRQTADIPRVPNDGTSPFVDSCTSRIERNCIIHARKACCYGRGAHSREPGSRCIIAIAMFPVGVASSSRGSTYANEARDRAHRLPTI